MVTAGGWTHVELVARCGARWLRQQPAEATCVDKPFADVRRGSAGGPQQPPDAAENHSYTDSHITVESAIGEVGPAFEAADDDGVYPTEAKAREREQRKAQKATGKTHVVKHRIKTVEEHDEVCSKGMSSLIGTY